MNVDFAQLYHPLDIKPCWSWNSILLPPLKWKLCPPSAQYNRRVYHRNQPRPPPISTTNPTIISANSHTNGCHCCHHTFYRHVTHVDVTAPTKCMRLDSCLWPSHVVIFMSPRFKPHLHLTTWISFDSNSKFEFLNRHNLVLHQELFFMVNEFHQHRINDHHCAFERI